MAGQRHIEGAYRLKDDTYRNYVPSIMWDYWVCGSQTVWKPLYTAVSKRVFNKSVNCIRMERLFFGTTVIACI